MLFSECQQLTWRAAEAGSLLGPRSTEQLTAWFQGRRTDCAREEPLICQEEQRAWTIMKEGRTALVFALPRADHDLQAKLEQNRVSLECLQQVSDVCYRLIQQGVNVGRRPVADWLRDVAAGEPTIRAVERGLAGDLYVGLEVVLVRSEAGYRVVPFRVNFDERLVPDLAVYSLLCDPAARPSSMDGVAAWLDDFAEILGWPDAKPSRAEALNKMLLWWMFGKELVLRGEFAKANLNQGAQFALDHRSRISESYLRQVAALVGLAPCSLPPELRAERGFKAKSVEPADCVYPVSYLFSRLYEPVVADSSGRGGSRREGEWLALQAPAMEEAAWTQTRSLVFAEAAGLGSVIHDYLLGQQQVVVELGTLLTRLEAAKSKLQDKSQEFEAALETVRQAQAKLEELPERVRSFVDAAATSLQQSIPAAREVFEKRSAEVSLSVTAEFKLFEKALAHIAEAVSKGQAAAAQSDQLVETLKATAGEIRRQVESLVRAAGPDESQQAVDQAVHGLRQLREELLRRVEETVAEARLAVAPKQQELNQVVADFVGTAQTAIGAKQQELASAVATFIQAARDSVARQQQELTGAVDGVVRTAQDTVAARQEELRKAVTGLVTETRGLLESSQRELATAGDAQAARDVVSKAIADLNALKTELATQLDASIAGVKSTLAAKRQKLDEAFRGESEQLDRSVGTIRDSLAAKKRDLEGALGMVSEEAVLRDATARWRGIEGELVREFQSFVDRVTQGLKARQEELIAQAGTVPAELLAKQQQLLVKLVNDWNETVRAEGQEFISAMKAAYGELTRNRDIAQARQGFVAAAIEQATLTDAEQATTKAKVHESCASVQQALVGVLDAERQAAKDALQAKISKLQVELNAVAEALGAEDNLVVSSLRTKLDTLRDQVSTCFMRTESAIGEARTRAVNGIHNANKTAVANIEAALDTLHNDLRAAIEARPVAPLGDEFRTRVEATVAAFNDQANRARTAAEAAQQSLGELQGAGEQLTAFNQDSAKLSVQLTQAVAQAEAQAAQCGQVNRAVTAVTDQLRGSLDSLAKVLGTGEAAGTEAGLLHLVLEKIEANDAALQAIRTRLCIVDGPQAERTRQWLEQAFCLVFPISKDVLPLNHAMDDEGFNTGKRKGKEDPVKLLQQAEAQNLQQAAGLESFKYTYVWQRAVECWLPLRHAFAQQITDMTPETILAICDALEQAWPHSDRVQAHVAAGRALAESLPQ